MGRLPVQSWMIVLPLCAVFGGASLAAAITSANSVASIAVVEPGGAVTEQQMVTGSVALPIMASIGASAGAISLPPPTGLTGLSPIRIGTEAFVRNIGRVVSRSGLQQASFTIIGDQGQVISITVPPSVSLSRLGGEGQVEFNPVTSLAGNGYGGSLVASADGSGELEFDVGGSVKPSSLATAGDYAGILRVTVQYN